MPKIHAIAEPRIIRPGRQYLNSRAIRTACGLVLRPKIKVRDGWSLSIDCTKCKRRIVGTEQSGLWAHENYHYQARRQA